MSASRRTLPVATLPYPTLLQQQPERESVRRLPVVEHGTRQGPVLHPGPLARDGDVLSLNLAAGCAHRCGFCSARAYPNGPAGDTVQLDTNVAERLASELEERARLPRAVYLSPATDPFPPLAEIQAATARVVEVLANHGVEAWLMTRGFIRPAVMESLATHADRVKVTVGITTLDRSLQRVLEPLAAPPRLRLRQIKQLRALGIPVQAALEPLLPGLTDTRTNLAALLEALAAAGIQHVTAGYLFLRPRIQEELVRALEPHGWAQGLLEAFEGGPVLHGGNVAAARYLPKARRQRGYAALMTLAANFGIRVSIGSVTNPDFAGPTRGKSVTAPARDRLPLFENMAATNRA